MQLFSKSGNIIFRNDLFIKNVQKPSLANMFVNVNACIKSGKNLLETIGRLFCWKITIDYISNNIKHCLKNSSCCFNETLNFSRNS